MRTVLLSLAFVITSSSVLAPQVSPHATASAPRAGFTYTGFTPVHHEVVDWALNLFAEAGLELPAIHFVGSEDRDDCQGRLGMARRTSEGSTIVLCANEASHAFEWLVLHEMAHAFDVHALDDERRAAFMQLRGLPAWREGDWYDRGAEHAAEIIAWGLIDRPTRPGHIDRNGCADLLAGYVALVGAPPLHGYTDACDR